MKRLLTYICLCFLSCAALSAQGKKTARLSFADGFEQKHSYVAISTNALYDALLVPNMGLEFNFYNNWTLHVNGMWAWWTMQDIHWYWRVYGGEASVKKYFGRQSRNRSMTGHHVGLYAQALSYDFEAGHFGRMAPDLSYGGGVEYGYSFPVSNELNIDFSLGIGYLGGRFYDYVENEGHYIWRTTVNQAWYGPTKASISLVWLISSNKTR